MSGFECARESAGYCEHNIFAASPQENVCPLFDVTVV